MHVIKTDIEKVLLAVGLRRDEMDKGELSLSTRHSFEKAVQVAKLYGASLTLLHVVDLPNKLWKRLEDAESREERIKARLEGVLSDLAQAAEKKGVHCADYQVLTGKPWTTVIQEVQARDIDLLMAGSAQRGPVLESLFGSTTLKLVKNCPCPVWVTKPREEDALTSILVAHDLTEVGSSALRWGVRAAELSGGKLHVLHALDPGDYYSFLSSALSTEIEAEQAQIRNRIADETKSLNSEIPVTIVTNFGSPQVQIFNYLRDHSIELLVMGTIARTGLAGIITGNTAETLLPWVQCSLIALKPEGFVSPVRPT